MRGDPVRAILRPDGRLAVRDPGGVSRGARFGDSNWNGASFGRETRG